MSPENSKLLGQYYTPPEVASTLLKWSVRSPRDRVLDPSCGEGNFLVHHPSAVGVEFCADAARIARKMAPKSRVHNADFFTWAKGTNERFDVVAGNPPFIRYQQFCGKMRKEALRLAGESGIEFSALTSSWAPFLAVAMGLLKRGGRAAFVVPAEIGHANYAPALLEGLCRNFGRITVVAIREKLFPQLSQDAWLLYATDYGGQADSMEFIAWDKFHSCPAPPSAKRQVSLTNWRRHGKRLRKFILPDEVLEWYADLASVDGVVRFNEIARIRIGYVTGANDFFHLRPSKARQLRLAQRYLRVAIRRGEQLPAQGVDERVVRSWLDEDRPVLLLDLSQATRLPKGAIAYLESQEGKKAQTRYKCRNRKPWYVVPDVTVPHAFLSYMSGSRPALVSNLAGCVCTNSVHAVRLHQTRYLPNIQKSWDSPVSVLSQELEGHSLGGGMLKLEPQEAGRVFLPADGLTFDKNLVKLSMEAVSTMRKWRHYG